MTNHNLVSVLSTLTALQTKQHTTTTDQSNNFRITSTKTRGTITTSEESEKVLKQNNLDGTRLIFRCLLIIYRLPDMRLRKLQKRYQLLMSLDKNYR